MSWVLTDKTDFNQFHVIFLEKIQTKISWILISPALLAWTMDILKLFFFYSFCRLSKFQEVKVGKFNTSMVPFLPSDLIDVLKWISPDPMAWFIGQFVKFILRPKPWLEKELDQLKKFHPGMYLYYLICCIGCIVG